jgi:hypothetical protein
MSLKKTYGTADEGNPTHMSYRRQAKPEWAKPNCPNYY